ncbi:MAG: spermidine/putrescine transporter permease [Alphaproteobacteria bacterium]|jgi:putrescine transport system permease protein|nr:spermidine/putrescine transporter permease [Alphaproteobacteria bacterium]
MRSFSRTSVTTLIVGYGFLYLPILMVIIFSFNESRLVTVWSRFSTKWYKELWTNEGLLDAVLASFKIASLAATASVVLGTLAAVTMVRFTHFRGRTLFSGLISTPLVMPDVITGLAALMMFVTFEQLIGWPTQRGILTITIAHITLAMAYVYLVVQARLQDFDRSIEEAALDLGARPLKVFLVIVLPLILPSLLAGWLLAFALSLDDVVIASFLSGPGATTLPMLIFSQIRLGVSPVINALATLIVGIVAMGVMIVGVIIHHQQKRG